VFWPKPDQAIQTASGTVLHNMVQAFFGKTDPKSDPAYMIWPDSGYTLAIMAITEMLPNWIWHVYWIGPVICPWFGSPLNLRFHIQI